LSSANATGATASAAAAASTYMTLAGIDNFHKM